MKLGLGTAQFGVNYGISNTVGKTLAPEVTAILDLAVRHGVRVVDTSPSYGDSESVLGSVLRDRHCFRVVTKTIKVMRDVVTPDDAAALEETFLGSLDRLGQASVYGLLVHQLDDLLASDGALLMERVQSLKARGLAEKIGLSLSRFTERQIDQVLDRYRIDLVQFPLSVLDQRLLASGRLRELKTAGVELHARSIFLQGLLLMRPEMLPPWFDRMKAHLRRYHDEIGRLGLSPVQAALDFVMGLDEVDAVICGVNGAGQLRELIACAQRATQRGSGCDFSRFAIEDDRFLNPTNWQVQAA